MSLTHEDLMHIEALFDRKLQPIFGELEGLRNDVKEIYDMISSLEKRSIVVDEDFYGLPPKEQILKTYEVLRVLAKKHNVVLPS